MLLSEPLSVLIQMLRCAEHRALAGSCCALMRSVVGVLYSSSVLCLCLVQRWLSAAAPELWVRREQSCKLLAINREQGGLSLEQATLVINQSVSRSYRDPPFSKK